MKDMFIIALILSLANVPRQVTAASIGDPAPPLTIERWIKGTPAVLTKRTNLLVVEFWATWCGPCKETIPHLTELQKKYADKGIVFLGMSDEDVATVQPFVAAQGNRMGYNVGTDSSQRTFKAWMTASGASGIPHAFIVDTKGTVVWHDHPGNNLEETIESILAGTYDVALARNFETGDRLVQHYTISNAAPVGERILAEFSRDWRAPYRLAKAILTDPEIRSRDVPLALRAANKATELTRERSYQSLEMRARALYASGQKEDAIMNLNKSIGVCNDSEDLPELKKLLALYEKNVQAASAPK
jgi:thiol-disulfide isomerase/thioredoxin